jgi:hypothetical protein
MRFPPTNRWRSAVRQRRPLSALPRNDDGSAAIEFGIVALPCLLFVLGLLGLGLYFLASTQLEYGAEYAARKVRTGEAENDKITVNGFKDHVCTAAGSYIDCDKLSVVVQHAATWSGITPQACVDGNGKMVGSTGSGDDMISKWTGSESEVVLVTLCYEWDLAKNFPFLNLGNDGKGPAIIQAATAFKSEPYK